MIIGVDISAACRKERTGVEEYVFQLVRYFAEIPEAKDHTFLVYMDPRVYMDHPLPVFFSDSKEHRAAFKIIFGFDVPAHFKLVTLYFPIAWRQVRLALHLLFKKPDILFMPTQLLPLFSPKRSVVMIHGLEYERFPQYYPDFAYGYLRLITLYSARRASKMITPSESTKKDLVDFYKVDPKKITVVYHGTEVGQKEQNCDRGGGYILYVGRMELKKNVQGLVDLFVRLKEKYKIPHKLMLIGPDGFGANIIRKKIENSGHKNDIIIRGHVAGGEKNRAMSCADILALVSFYEGFGLTLIEAQKLGVPVLCSDNSSMSEISGAGAVKIDPNNILVSDSEVFAALTDKNKRENMIRSGYDNAKRFDWERCAKETLKVLLS